ncbi:AraC family transcriptional regulator [Bacillus sp. JJ1562]|uniref:AraC family transcriptional regulator n=1 Tax=Bacillus sp. JJ1562 TaxID=3122960 RepID=UPI003002568F
MKIKKTIHVLNGQVMYNHFKKTQFLEQELMVPFNEAMCFGETSSNLFSEEFIDIRSKVHQVTTTQYNEITLKPLKPFFTGKFTHINLWFDADMFCQINLLTVLAWLDRVKYQGDVQFHLVDDRFEVLNHFNLEVEGYYDLYKNVLIDKEMPRHIEPPTLEKGIELYLNYLNQDSILIKFIKEHQHVQEKELVSLLLNNFKEYGLGDLQYKKMIETTRNK